MRDGRLCRLAGNVPVHGAGPRRHDGGPRHRGQLHAPRAPSERRVSQDRGLLAPRSILRNQFQGCQGGDPRAFRARGLGADGAGPRCIRQWTPVTAERCSWRAGRCMCAIPTEAIRAGIAYLTEDRKELGLYLNMPIRDNLIAPTLRRFTGALRLHAEQADQRIRRRGRSATSPSWPRPRSRKSGSCPAETSRSASWPRGWGRSPRPSSWTSRPGAWMSLPARTSTPRSRSWPAEESASF